ncbi:MAG: SDR family oxidoreductase [Chloroflexi bacterium]|nr:SDR family oxidoreductase [Chloroflexota bacterium]
MIFRDDALKGKVAFVTGGGTGIGRGIALELSRVGAKLIIASRSLEHLEPTAREIEALGAECFYMQMDVRVRPTVDHVVEEAIQRFGGIDILVNNAAGNFLVPFEDMSENAWRSVVGIDLDGTFHCTQAVGRHMIARGGGGSVINIVFSGAWQAAPYDAHAAAAKAGVLALTRSLAVEWSRHGIRVNAISPGPIRGTEGVRRLSAGATEADRAGGVPLGRMGEIEEIGWACVFLASDAAAFITGECLSVDGARNQLGRSILRTPPQRPRPE